MIKTNHSKLLPIAEALKHDGYYSLINKSTHVMAQLVIYVKDGKVYDDMALSEGFGAWSNKEIAYFINEMGGTHFMQQWTKEKIHNMCYPPINDFQPESLMPA